MKYYEIRESLNKKDIGIYPQVVHANHNCHVWDEPKFIDRINYTKIDFDPITSNAILEKKAKVTDLISSGGIGFSLKLLLSDKLKNILKKYSNDKCQFFQAPIIYMDELIYNYYILYPYKFQLEYIDFENSIFTLKKRKKEGGTYSENVKVANFKEFQHILSNRNSYEYTQFYIDRIKLKPHVQDVFFILRHVKGGIKYICSEKLKKEIEDAQCTGIEFMPIEMKLTEWLQGGEREKIYGKA